MKNLFANLIILSVLLAACRKNVDIFVPDPGQQIDSQWVAVVSDDNQAGILSDSLFESPYSENIDASSDDSIKTNEGYVIYFPAHCLQNSSGTTIDGEVKVEYRVLLHRGEFIRYVKPTSTDRRPLVSGGVCFIRLTKNGQEINLAPDKSLKITYADDRAESNMAVYYGNDGGPTGSTSFDLARATDNSSVKMVNYTTTSGTMKGYTLDTYRTHWVGIGRVFENANGITDVNVVLPDLFSNANTQVYIAFNDFRSVVQMIGDAGSRKFWAPSIPVGVNIKIVTLSKVADTWYLGVKDAKSGDGTSIFVKPEISDLSRIEGFLKSL